MLMKILEKLSYRLHGGSADLALYIDHEGTIREMGPFSETDWRLG